MLITTASLPCTHACLTDLFTPISPLQPPTLIILHTLPYHKYHQSPHTSLLTVPGNGVDDLPGLLQVAGAEKPARRFRNHPPESQQDWTDVTLVYGDVKYTTLQYNTVEYSRTAPDTQGLSNMLVRYGTSEPHAS